MSRGYVSSLRVSFIRWSFDKIGGSVDLTKALESAKNSRLYPCSGAEHDLSERASRSAWQTG